MIASIPASRQFPHAGPALRLENIRHLLLYSNYRDPRCRAIISHTAIENDRVDWDRITGLIVLSLSS